MVCRKQSNKKQSNNNNLYNKIEIVINYRILQTKIPVGCHFCECIIQGATLFLWGWIFLCTSSLWKIAVWGGGKGAVLLRRDCNAEIPVLGVQIPSTVRIECSPNGSPQLHAAFYQMWSQGRSQKSRLKLYETHDKNSNKKVDYNNVTPLNASGHADTNLHEHAHASGIPELYHWKLKPNWRFVAERKANNQAVN